MSNNNSSGRFNDLVFNQASGLSINDEILNALRSVSMIDIMFEFFGDDFMEDPNNEMEIAQQESFNNYNTQEKNPSVILDIDSSIATFDHINENCTICISRFHLNEKITEMECTHIFHTSCISEWVKYKSDCPVCRKSIKTKKI
jgi:hypothetical protein